MSLVYLICTSPRSGSTLLCKGLTNTGRAGAPDEFFDHRTEVTAYWMYRLAISKKSEFTDKIVEATSTPNGIFGTKVHWTTWRDMRRALGDSLTPQVTDVRHRSLTELLHARFSAVRYIWLRRRNKVAQGISHFRAARSDLWEIPRGRLCDTSGAGDSIEFDFRMIDHCIRRAIEFDWEWKHHFTRHGLTPMQLVYEDLIASYDSTIRKVLEFLDVPHSDLPEAEPHLERMANAESLEWAKKYREIKAGNSAHWPVEPGIISCAQGQVLKERGRGDK
jgi:LPS sulfotransferase NodH